MGAKMSERKYKLPYNTVPPGAFTNSYKICIKDFTSKIWLETSKGGTKYPENEMSFRQTISCHDYSDRGFHVELNKRQRKIEISFDSQKVDSRHSAWLKSVEERVGLAA